MKKTYAILNAIAIIAVIAWNGYTTAYGLNGNEVGELSDSLDNLFTPAGYAFSIWSVIFIALLILAIYVLKLAYDKDDDGEIIEKISPWFIITNVLNCVWVYVWLYEYTALSVIVMLGILMCLLITVVRLNINRETRSAAVRYCIALPISIYAGWISVATVANISAYLAKNDIDLGMSELTWCIIMIAIAALINVYMVMTRRMYGYGFVGIWAITAIAVRHNGNVQSIFITAIIAIAVIALAIIIRGLQTSTKS